MLNINFLIDNRRQALYIIILFSCLWLPSCLNLSNKLNVLFQDKKPELSNILWYYLRTYGNGVMGSFLTLGVLFKYIRKYNETITLFNDNIYHDYSYLWFFICSKFFGYKSCNLIRVPISMQFKLVMRNTFESYPISEESFPSSDIPAEVKYINEDVEKTNEFNLILEDTYPISFKQIDDSKKSLKTIIIRHSQKNDASRLYNVSFVKKVNEEVRNLPDGSVINLYATTNPKHNYEIAKQVFSLANRNNIKKLYIYQQEASELRRFTKSVQVYRFYEMPS